MLKVAITGNIASGKSLVGKYLSDKGFKVIDADKIGHEILEKDEHVIEEIKSYFSLHDIFDSEGKIDRAKLGAIIFSNSGLKYKLEKILHPLILDKINMYFERYSSLPVVFVEIPLLYEAKMEDNFDVVILVAADEDIRLMRLLNRSPQPFAQAKSRIKSQLSQDEKAEKADYVIYNNTSDLNLKFQISLVINRIVNKT